MQTFRATIALHIAIRKFAEIAESFSLLLWGENFAMSAKNNLKHYLADLCPYRPYRASFIAKSKLLGVVFEKAKKPNANRTYFLITKAQFEKVKRAYSKQLVKTENLTNAIEAINRCFS